MLKILLTGLALAALPALAAPSAAEVRGTWLTTTANDAIASPARTAQTMQRLREIGLNTVYVESWKNGYTQFPSQVLERTIGVSQRPPAQPQDPSESAPPVPRDLVQETLIEAHRHGLVYVSWFEYGFMAAHQQTMNHLRRLKPEWLSRDASGSEVAPNGFVWLNPLHPQARRFLLELVLEAVDRYDLDGVQLDDRIVWPYLTMGYDEVTRAAYAAEHGGAQPPADPRDPAWMRWRAQKVDHYAKWFVQELRARRPGLLVSVSPGPYPWSWEHYLLNWPAWAAWTRDDRLRDAPFLQPAAAAQSPRWDEFIPQAYRLSAEAFRTTWREQIDALKAAGGYRPQELVAGIRIVGDGRDSSWQQLRESIDFVRAQRNGGHVLWFSRGVLDLYPRELAQFYGGFVPSPRFPPGWRPGSIALLEPPQAGTDAVQDPAPGQRAWTAPLIPPGRYRVIGFDGSAWRPIGEQDVGGGTPPQAQQRIFAPAHFGRVELLVDRRAEMARPIACREAAGCR